MHLFRYFQKAIRGGSSAAATSKIERFVIIVNGWKPLTIIKKRSILDVAAALDPLLAMTLKCLKKNRLLEKAILKLIDEYLKLIKISI